MSLTFALIIPTLNAERHLKMSLPKIAAQTIQPNQFIVLDSQSKDQTCALVEEANATVVPIQRANFNHGGTRNIGLNLSASHDIAIFMTQDAILADEFAFERLLAPFDDQSVGAVYGRQIARREAGPIESFARQFNYPPISQLRSAADIPKIGFKTCFCSNSFAAYRTHALLEVGGFRDDVILSEDTIGVAELIMKGKKVGYIADSIVEHSHDYTIAEEFRRYFDIGVLHSREKDLLAQFGSVGEAGRDFVIQELRFLIRVAPWLIPEAIIRTMSKFTAYKLGGVERKLPMRAKRQLSMNSRFWWTLRHDDSNGTKNMR